MNPSLTVDSRLMIVSHLSLPSRLTAAVCRIPAFVAAVLGACLNFSASPAHADQPPIVVSGQSIGNDFSIDLSFGDTGYTIVNYNDANGTDDEGLRITAADGGGYWLIGMHAPDSGGQTVAISKLDAD